MTKKSTTCIVYFCGFVERLHTDPGNGLRQMNALFMQVTSIRMCICC
jgi:hypothetical protein